ncbi:MAG: hypothetical protein ACI9EW_003296 [Cellvibrionaceae bacterium]|jgi:hypothetical protein
MQQTATWYEERKHRSFHNSLEKMWDTSPLMTGVAFVHILLVIACLFGLVIDTRTLLGELIWIKPLKFAISGAIYCGTIAWMLTFVTKGKWLSRLIAGSNAVLMAGEVGAVALQASRGVRSHYNLTTPFDETIWTLMGTMIMLMWVVNLILIIFLMFQPFKDFAFKSAMILGVMIAFVGGLTAFGMTEQKTPAQQAALDNGEQLTFSGGHTMGAEDGGEGLPFVGWSTTHGDLRPAHFIGLHGLQLIPLLGLFINRRWSMFSVGRRTFMVFIGAMAYLGIIYALFQQAMNQLPITSFDTATMLILILVAVSYGTLWNLAIKGGHGQIVQPSETFN